MNCKIIIFIILSSWSSISVATIRHADFQFASVLKYRAKSTRINAPHGRAHSGQTARLVLTRSIVFYSYALAEFWVQASGYDWHTPDTRPWCRTTVSRQLTRCCWPPDAWPSSSPSSAAAVHGFNRDACWSRFVVSRSTFLWTISVT